MIRIALPIALVSLMACGTETVDSAVFGPADSDPMLGMERGDAVKGTLVLDDSSVIRFGSQATPAGLQVRVELNGIALTANYTSDFADLNGVNLEDGTPAFITHEDRADLMRLTAALEAELLPPVEGIKSKAEYDAIRSMTDAEARLFSSVEGLWAQWPSTLPLDTDFKLEDTRSSSWRYYTDGTVLAATHDCWDCDDNESDCTDYKSMGAYFDGANHGNCGISSNGSQFTFSCAGHDQCVRTSKHGGHSLASAWCDDDFIPAAADELTKPSCDYDWRGSSVQNACPTSWSGTNDGCDCFCQFRDADCSF